MLEKKIFDYIFNIKECPIIGGHPFYGTTLAVASLCSTVVEVVCKVMVPSVALLKEWSME